MIDHWCDITVDNNDYQVVVPLKPQASAKPVDVAIQAVHEITQVYPPPYYVMVSGGADSQSMLWAWHNSGVEFTPVSAVFNRGLNNHDHELLKKFVHLHSITPVKYFDFNAISFFNSSEYTEYVYRYRCGSPHIVAHMKMSETFQDGTVIFSGDPITSPTSFPVKNTWGLYKYARQTNRNIVPFFFMSTSELTSAFENIRRKTKFLTLQAGGFPIISQPGAYTKYTGFERIKDIYDDFANHINVVADHKALVKRLPSQGSKRVFDVLLRNKYEYEFKDDRLDFRVHRHKE